jgi:tetratricopeptide (TPR) repeat protein
VVDGFAQFLIVTGGNREGEETFMLALNALGKSSLGVAPDLLAIQSPLAANLAWFQSGLSRSQAALETATWAVALADRGQDALSRAYGLSILGWALQMQGSYDESGAALTEALDVDRESGNLSGVTRHLGNIGATHYTLGDYPQALVSYQQAARIEQGGRAQIYPGDLAGWAGRCQSAPPGRLPELAGSQNSERLAQVYYELWRMDGGAEYAFHSLAARDLTAGHGPDHPQRLAAGDHGLGQRRIRRLVGQIQAAGEEADEGAALQRDVVANGAPQHRIADLQGVQHRALGHHPFHLKRHLLVDLGQGAQVVRDDDADHARVCTSTDSTGGRSRTMAVQLSPLSAEAYTCPPVVPK